MMIGRLRPPNGLGGREASPLDLSCAFRSCASRPVASDAAIAEPRNPRRLMDMKFSLLTKRREGYHGRKQVGQSGRHSDSNHLQQSVDTLAKVVWLGDQAQHKIAFVRKIVEVSRMHDDAHLPQEIDGQVLVSSKDRDA